MRIVLDSNVLVASVGKKSRLRPIWEAFIAGSYKLVVSEDILKEYEEILQEHAAPGAASIIMEIFIESPDVITQKVYYNWNAITVDPDDNKFFDIAVASDADYLVTNDRHFDKVKTITFPTVKVITSKEFLTLLTKR